MDASTLSPTTIHSSPRYCTVGQFGAAAFASTLLSLCAVVCSAQSPETFVRLSDIPTYPAFHVETMGPHFEYQPEPFDQGRALLIHRVAAAPAAIAEDPDIPSSATAPFEPIDKEDSQPLPPLAPLELPKSESTDKEETDPILPQFDNSDQSIKDALPSFHAEESVEVDRANPVAQESYANISKPVWIPDTANLDQNTSFWWNRFLAGSILGRETIPMSSNSLAVETLQHSPTVELLAARPQAVRTTITEEAARFDWSVFIESRWRDSTEPIGSSLTTGGPNLFRNEQLTNEAGVRKTNRFGGDLSVGQLFGHERSNSQFFVPQNQGATTLTIDYTQPLLRGAGRQVNESTVVLASLASDSADMEFVGQIQDTLADVSANYWQLYLARATLLIERRLYHRATETLTVLKKREKVDASKEMISRTKLALAARKTRLINARRTVLDQQTYLRTVVNSPSVNSPNVHEFVPTELPAIIQAKLSVEDAFVTALQNRPEVTRTLKQIEAARVRHQVSENELLPELNLVLQTYAQGLRGDFDIQRAFRDQFEGAEPSYSAGLLFEVPIGRRAANARLTRRQIEIAEIAAQFRVEVQRILFDVVTELRQLETTRRTLQTNQQALDAASDTLKLLETRHRLLSSEQDRNSSLRLQDILNSHVRVSDAEIAVVQSQIEHALATIRLRRALGVLVRPTT